MLKKHFVILISVLLVFTLAGAACAKDEVEKGVKDYPVAKVSVQTLEPRVDNSHFFAIGRVKNVRESTIASKVMGKVTSVKVTAGKKVKKGQILMQIDDRDARGRVAQARGALTQAKAAKLMAKQMLDRWKELKRTDSASQAKFDQAVFDYNSAKGAVEQAKGAYETANSYLKETTVVAPFSGTIIDTMIEHGEMASPGYPLLRMEGKHELEFEATVNGQDINLLSVGQDAKVILDISKNEQKEIGGNISEIVPSSDRVTHSNLVRIKLDDESSIRSGMFGRAKFTRDASSCPGLMIDEDLIIRHGQLSAAYILDSTNTIRLRLIKIGRKSGNQVELLSGIGMGDQLIVSDNTKLHDGQKAEVVQ
jgi:RND family efflux transporter MFP subunit